MKYLAISTQFHVLTNYIKDYYTVKYMSPLASSLAPKCLLHHIMVLMYGYLAPLVKLFAFGKSFCTNQM